MGFVKLAEGDLNYRFDGPQDAPVLVLSNSLGTDLHMWDEQVAAFSEHFRVLRFDTRGHGPGDPGLGLSEVVRRVEQMIKLGRG